MYGDILFAIFIIFVAAIFPTDLIETNVRSSVERLRVVSADASDFADERRDGGGLEGRRVGRSRGAKCKKRIAHKVTPWGYARQIPIGRPVPSKNRDWSKVAGRLTYPQSNVTSHANSRVSNHHPSPSMDSALGLRYLARSDAP